jgi:hypothetical protein
MRHATAWIAAGAAATALLAGCDRDRDPPDEPPAELLRSAAMNPVDSGVSQIELDLTLQGESLLAGPSRVSLDGPFALDETGLPRFELALDAEVAGFGIDGALVSTGEDAFVVFFGENYRVGAGRVAAVEAQLAGLGGTEGGLGLDVASWFEQPAYAGEEDVAGAETERIEGTLRSEAVSRDLNTLAGALGAPALVRALAAGVQSGPVDASVAFDDGTIRRLRAQFPFTVPADQRDSTSQITGGTVALQAEVSDVGSEAEIEPPAGGGFQPIEDLIRRLRSLASLGGL